jgi:hypothetical protein
MESEGRVSAIKRGQSEFEGIVVKQPKGAMSVDKELKGSMTVYKQLNGVIPVDKQLSETNS